MHLNGWQHSHHGITKCNLQDGDFMSNDNVEVLYEWENYHYFDILSVAQELADKLINMCYYSKTRVISG